MLNYNRQLILFLLFYNRSKWTALDGAGIKFMYGIHSRCVSGIEANGVLMNGHMRGPYSSVGFGIALPFFAFGLTASSVDQQSRGRLGMSCTSPLLCAFVMP